MSRLAHEERDEERAAGVDVGRHVVLPAPQPVEPARDWDDPEQVKAVYAALDARWRWDARPGR